MANNKTGLNYYGVDTDRYMDLRVRRLVKDHGCRGLAVYDYLLCEVYRVQGCFAAWDESTAFNVAEYFGLKESNVLEIVKYCGVVGLFDKELLSRGIITSASIQRRYLEMCSRAKRRIINIPEFCRIIPEQSDIIPEQSQIIPEVCGKRKKERNISTTTTAREDSKKLQDSVNDFSATPEKGCAEKVPPVPLPEGTYEYVPIKELAEWMKSQHQWLEAFCMNHHLDPEYVKRNIGEFAKECENNGEVAKDKHDCKRHFNNWLRKVREQPKTNYTNDKRTYNKTEPPSADELDRAVAEGLARAHTRQEWE